MSYAVENTASLLKAARKRKRLSQAQLGSKVGLPQSHISKIESGAVDLQLSSLLELARVLDLELVLVPRKVVPAVRSLIRNAQAQNVSETDSPDRPRKAPVTPAYSLDENEDDG